MRSMFFGRMKKDYNFMKKFIFLGILIIILILTATFVAWNRKGAEGPDTTLNSFEECIARG